MPETKYTKEQYDALIEEQLREVRHYEQLERLRKTDSGRSILGWAAIILMLVTVLLGGMIGGKEGFVAGSLAVAALIGYFKSVNLDTTISQNIIANKDKLQNLRDARGEA